MNSSIRTTGIDRSSVHHVHKSSDSSIDSELITLINRMKEEQQFKNKELVVYCKFNRNGEGHSLED